MAVAASLLVGEPPLASPELALVDAELAAELRRTLSPVVDSWLPAPARVPDASAGSEMDAPAQLESPEGAGHAESRDAEQLHDDGFIVSAPEQTPVEELPASFHYPVLRVLEPEAAFEDFAPGALDSLGEASADREDAGPARWDVADLLRETEPRDADEHGVDEYIVAVTEKTLVEEQRTSHYPALPAPEPEREAIEETDEALRRIRERLNEPNESPARRSRVRRRFTFASGVVAMSALGVFAVDAELHLAQLPSWLPF